MDRNVQVFRTADSLAEAAGVIAELKERYKNIAIHDRGNRFIMFDNMDIGQFYAVTADNRDPYYLYGGLQDSGNWGGPSNSRDYNGILGDHWFKFHSGDGFQMPGRARSGELYRDYHHKGGFARRTVTTEVADGWMWPGPEWFDNDHPIGNDGRPATPETLPRDYGA